MSIWHHDKPLDIMSATVKFGQFTKTTHAVTVDIILHNIEKTVAEFDLYHGDDELHAYFSTITTQMGIVNIETIHPPKTLLVFDLTFV